MKKSLRSKIQKICVRVAPLLLAIAIFRIVLHFNHGFHPWAITRNMPDNLASFETNDAPLNILEKKFYFLAKGKQAFAFQSECGKYVLKIPNNHYYRRLQLLKCLPKIPFVSQKIAYNTLKLNKTFKSYLIACTDLKEHSAIVYAHLSPSSRLQLSLQLVDSLGREYKVPAAPLAFLIQKKAELVYPYLSSLRETGSFEEAECALDALLNYLERRCQLGIGDNDPLIRTNLGYIDGSPVQIDIGPFSYDPEIANPKVYQKELLRICTSLNEWLNVHFPEVRDHFARQLKSKMHEYEEDLPKPSI